MLLEVQDLTTYFHTRNGVVKAVDGISFGIDRNETVGIVGESGSGKSVSCYSLLGLLPMPPARIEKGRALFDGVDLLHCDKETLRNIRGKRISMIFQDPMTCLNPYLKVGEQIIEPLLVHDGVPREAALKLAAQGLKDVGIFDAEKRLEQYPHQFSGGMRQRVMIAMALITKPDLLIADEPTTALDVTVQAQILELIRRLQKDRGTAVIFITHDLGVIAGLADRVVVLYAGRIAEHGKTRDVFYHSKHPYTKALLASIPATHMERTNKGEELYTIPGLPPDLSKKIDGCPFSPRCDKVQPGCRVSLPHLLDVNHGHLSACIRVQEGSL